MHHTIPVLTCCGGHILLMVFFSKEREVGQGWWDAGWCKTVKLKEKSAKTKKLSQEYGFLFQEAHEPKHTGSAKMEWKACSCVKMM